MSRHNQTEVDWINNMTWVKRIKSLLPERYHEMFIDQLLDSVINEKYYLPGDIIDDFNMVSDHISNGLAGVGIAMPIKESDADEYSSVLVFERALLKGIKPPSAFKKDYCEILAIGDDYFSNDTHFFLGIKFTFE